MGDLQKTHKSSNFGKNCRGSLLTPFAFYRKNHFLPQFWEQLLRLEPIMLQVAWERCVSQSRFISVLYWLEPFGFL